jgi:formylglycine-generating enzyme required for sulfatase activity
MSSAGSIPALSEQVLIPAGPFLFGEGRTLTYLAPYEVDRYPVTVERYAAFVQAAGHPVPKGWESPDGPPGRRDHPVTGVSWFDALAFARHHDRVLPSEEQWEKAARGTGGLTYPWGDRFNVRYLNSRGAKKRGTTPVTAYPDGASPFGVMDLAGNVWEWTDTWFDLDGDLKVLKGGSFALTKEYAITTHRHYNDPRFGNNLTGFRTVRPL